MKPSRSRPEKIAIADAVQRFIDGNGISRPDLAKMTKLSGSTIDHFFIGSFSETTLAKINFALKTSYGTIERAPNWCGGYDRGKAAEYEGAYLTLRPNFSKRASLIAYLTHLSWGPLERGHVLRGDVQFKPSVPAFGLVFQETRIFEPKYEHSGHVWIPKGNYIYLFTTYGEGRFRGAILCDFDREKRLKGVQLTLANPKGAAFIPAACPIAYVKNCQPETEDLGLIDSKHKRYDEYAAIIGEAASTMVLLNSPTDEVLS